MKNLNTFTRLVTIILFSFLLTGLKAQNVTVTLLTPVCNHDGAVVATVSAGFPVSSYIWYTSAGQVNHFSSSLTDTLFNCEGGNIMVMAFPNNGSFPIYGYIQVPYPFQVNSTVVADTCPMQTGSVSLAVLGGIAPYSFSWTFNGSAFPGNTNTISNLSGGYYDCTIMDMSGCQMNLSDLDSNSAGNGIFVPSINSIVLLNSTTPANCTNGTATTVPSGGAPPYSYFWSNGQTTSTATNLSAQTYYSVTVTDLNGCIQQAGFYISSTVNINVNTSITNANCSFNDGAITAIPTGGTGPYTYLWNTFATTNAITGIPSGSYVVTVADAMGCIGNDYAYVTALTPVNVTFTSTPSICTGATGSISSVVTGGTPPYYYQWFTLPVQNTPNATGLAPGSYNFLITDAQLCTRTGIVSVPQNTNLLTSLSTTANVCALNNGTATLSATGGILPYTYLWSNSQVTPSISGMPSTYIFGTVTDAAGCYFTECGTINQVSTMSFLLMPVAASCKYTADGSISVNINNGTPPYTYSWSTGANTPVINNLLPGYYSVTVTDANGCSYYQFINLSFNSLSPCTGTVQGYVFIDLNNNCQKDLGEPVMENIPIECVSTSDVVFTDVNGFYSITVPVGNVDIQQLPVEYRYQVCPSSNPFTLNIPTGGTVLNQDISDTVDWVNDLAVGIYNWSSPPVVGSSFVMRIVEFNRGTIALPSTSQYDFDQIAPYQNASPGPNSLNIPAHIATFDNALALPLVAREIDVTHSIPLSVPINTLLNYTDTIFPVSGDTTWWDNSEFRQVLTLGSYDPNYKEVTPRGSGPSGIISQADSVLEYVIHFQNVGNYYANKVIILDTLDSDLDFNSLRIVYATHNQSAEISGTGLLKFTFDYINLPSIAQDTLLSNGFVVYTIRLKPNLPDGTEITNSSDIYFDFNSAVRTNTTLNTINITALPEINSGIDYTVYPNPNKGQFTLLFKDNSEDIIRVNLSSITGQRIYEKVHSFKGGNSLFIDAGKLSPGVYLLQLTGKGDVKNSMIVVE